MCVRNSCCSGGSLVGRFFLVLWLLLAGPALQCAYAVSVTITEPEDSEMFRAYDEDEEDHDWSVDFTASGAPADPDGVYRWYHGEPPNGALRKSGKAAEGGDHYTCTVDAPVKRIVYVTYTVNGESATSDTRTLWYVQARMELDAAPATEEYDPGLFIGLDDNNSDEFYGQGDDSLDYLQTDNFGWPLAEDFRTLRFKVNVGSNLWPHDGQFTLRFTGGGEDITRPFEQGEEGWVPVSLANYQKDATRDWQRLRLQGKGFGTSVIELELPLQGTESAKDRVRLTTVGDLDADVGEDLEQEPPGCVIAYNNDDDDGDGIVDYNDPVNGQEDDREPIVLSVGSGASAVGDMKLRAIQGATNIAVWTEQVGGDLELLPVRCDVAELPLTFWLSGVDPGETKLILEHEDNRGPWTVAGDRLLISVVNVDLDADSDRTGAVEGTLLEDEAETTTPAVVMVNNDDDDADGYRDCVGSSVDGQDDVEDLAELVIRSIGLDSLPPDWEAALSVSDANKVRIFDQRSTSGTAVIGPEAGSQYAIPDITSGNLTYGVEFLDYRGEADETVTVTLSVGPGGSPVRSDEVTLMAAPFILLPNTRPADKVYVVETDGNAAFVSALNGYLGSTRVVEVPGGEDEYGHWWWDAEQGEWVWLPDVWVQDEVEIGYTRVPATGGGYADTHVVWDLPRDRDLDPWPENELLGPGFGGFAEGSGDGDENYGGNLEVTPPVTVGGTEYKFGRAVVGSNMDDTLKNFITAQDVQTPLVEPDVGWLLIGHVDEVISFVPDGSGFKVLIADTDLAKDLLDGLNRDDTGTASSGGNDTLTDTSRSWEADGWADGIVKLTAGTGSGQVRQVGSNTADTITVTRDWDTNPDGTSGYEVLAASAYRALFIEGDEELGVATGATASTLTDSTKNWSANQWQDGYVRIVAGTGEGQVNQVTSNTGTMLTVSSNWTTTPDATSRYVLAEDSKLGTDDEPAMYTVSELLRCTPLWTSGDNSKGNDYWQSKIDQVRNTLRVELGLGDGDFVEVPAVYRWDPSGPPYQTNAYVPGMVNMLVVSPWVFVPKPFGPRDAQGDVFEKYVSDEFEERLPGTGIIFLDDWTPYHVGDGEIHCGTNAKRTPPPDVTWWEDEE